MYNCHQWRNAALRCKNHGITKTCSTAELWNHGTTERNLCIYVYIHILYLCKVELSGSRSQCIVTGHYAPCGGCASNRQQNKGGQQLVLF